MCKGSIILYILYFINRKAGSRSSLKYSDGQPQVTRAKFIQISAVAHRKIISAHNVNTSFNGSAASESIKSIIFSSTHGLNFHKISLKIAKF